MSESDPQFILETLPPVRQRPTLLVIDEDSSTIELCQNLGLRVVAARNFEDGERVAALHLPSAALIATRQGRDGLGPAIERIRVAAKNAHLPIFVASPDGELDTRLTAALAGSTLFLDKPLNEQKLSDMLSCAPFVEPFAARIVIVDDDELVLERYQTDLEGSNYHVRCVHRLEKLVEVLEDVRPDVVLLDVNLGDVSGIDICRALRCSPRWQFLPILIFSSDDHADMRVQAYQAGATDVLRKPLGAEELMTRVHVQAQRIQAVRKRSDLDPLSGLTLRRAFTERARLELDECRRESKPFSLALFDIDLFKQINDRHGHLVGDRVIAFFGALLRKRFRAADLRCRWGGEEFLVAFPGEDAALAQRAAERILEDLRKTPFEAEDGTKFFITCTAGVAETPRDGLTLEALVKRADDLLYRGKESGRARVCDSLSVFPQDPIVPQLGVLHSPS